QDPIMEDEAANSNSDLVDAETEVAAPSSEEAAAPDEAANEGQTGQVPPPMPVVEAPSPIASDVEDDAEDHLEESQPPPQNGADAAQQADEDAEENQGVGDEEPHQAEQEDDHGNEDGDQEDDEDENGAALLQQLSESLRQQTDSSDRDQRDSRSHSRDEADRQLDNHRRELDQLQSNLRRELAEEKRQLDQRLARRQQGLPAGDSAAGEDRPSRLTLDNPIHMALNLRPDNSVRSYLPAEMLSSRQGAASTSAVGQHRVLPSTLTSEELRLLDDVRQRLSRASIEEQQQQQPPLPPPQPRPRQQQRQPPYRHRVADPAPFAQAAPDSDGDEEGIDPLVRSTHERLAGVSDRIRRYQQETSDYFNQSVLLGCSPTERGEAAAANGGHYAVDQHSFDDLAEHGDFKSRVGRGANRRYNGHSSASPVSAAVASAASPPSVRGGSEPPPLSLLHQLSPADAVDNFDAEVAAVSRRRRNHPSASSRLGAGERQDGANAAASAAAFDEERRHLLRELREARAEASRAAELRHQLEAAHAALKEAAEGVASVRREHATALARERAESERLRARLTEARAETDKLRRRLAAAESERMFLRNRERGVGSHSLSGDWSEEQAPEQSRFSAGLDSVLGSDGRRSPTEALRQSLADLERRQLIDSLPQARDSMGGGGGGGGGAPAWDRDAQLAEIRTLEQRYDQLQLEKRRVETALNHVPSVGSAKYGRQSREDKERLEKRLDSIDRELGSLRITLRQYHVIRSTC
ncbi:hypothetical protein BOX15_Mlig022315g1, partial [Macrostomum lignano]